MLLDSAQFFRLDSCALSDIAAAAAAAAAADLDCTVLGFAAVAGVFDELVVVAAATYHGVLGFAAVSGATADKLFVRVFDALFVVAVATYRGVRPTVLDKMYSRIETGVY